MLTLRRCVILVLQIEKINHRGRRGLRKTFKLIHSLVFPVSSVVKSLHTSRNRNRCSRMTLLLLNQCRSPRSADRFAIDAAIDFPANPAHFINHAKAVAQHFNFASRIVIPTHGNLAQAKLRQVRQIDQFNVESKAIYPGNFDQRTTDAHAKSFEATLCVPEWQAGRQTDDHVENSAALLASPGLMHANQAAIQSARTESK